jgi:DNA damage-inducible protein 1
MRLVVTFNHNDDVISIDVSDEMTVADLKAYIDTEAGSPTGVLFHNGKPMNGDDKELKEWGLQDDDMIIVFPPPRSASNTDNSNLSVSGETGDVERLYSDIERVRQQLSRDPVLREGVEQKYPQLIGVINDPERFRDVMIKVEKERVEEE